VGDGLLHHDRVEDHCLGTALADDAGLVTRRDRLREPSFNALLADPPALSGQRGRVDRGPMVE
jgi:hypothetical protein